MLKSLSRTDHNRCTKIDGSRHWCYTTNKRIRWDYCDCSLMRAPVPFSIQDKTCGLIRLICSNSWITHLTTLFSKSHDRKCDRNSNKSLHMSRRQNSMPYFSKIYSPDNKKASHKEFPWQVLIPDDDIRCAGTLVKLDVSNRWFLMSDMRLDSNQWFMTDF